MSKTVAATKHSSRDLIEPKLLDKSNCSSSIDGVTKHGLTKHVFSDLHLPSTRETFFVSDGEADGRTHYEDSNRC